MRISPVNSIGNTFRGAYIEAIRPNEIDANLYNEFKTARPAIQFAAESAPDDASLLVKGDKDGIVMSYSSPNGNTQNTKPFTKSIHENLSGEPVPVHISLMYLAHTLIANGKRTDKITS